MIRVSHLAGAPMRASIILAALTLALAACGSSQPAPGEVERFDAIGDDEPITVFGTEPFWRASVAGSQLDWSTSENAQGTRIAITRFRGNGGLGLSGQLDGEALHIAITPGRCEDAMSDKRYSLVATVRLGERRLLGCAYTPSHPAIEPQPRPAPTK